MKTIFDNVTAASVVISSTVSALLRADSSGIVSTTTLSANFALSAGGTLSLATALTSINSVTASTTTDLTLSGGSSGASLVLGQGTSGIVTITPKGAGNIESSTVFRAMAASDGGQLALWTTNAQAIDIGAALTLGGFNDDGQSNRRVFGAIAGRKANGLSTSSSGYLAFFTDLSAAVTERMRLNENGNLLIGGTTDISGSGGLKVFGTTAATSTTTGSLVNAGGFGNSGAAYIGGLLSISHASAGANSAAIANTSATGFGAIIRGGDTRASTRYVAQFVDYSASAAPLTVYSDAVAVAATTSSTSTTSGALTVAGGAGVAGALYVAGGSGAFVTDGTRTLRLITDSTTGYIGTSTSHPLNLQTSAADRVTISATGVVAVLATAEATTAGAGAITVAGGIYAAKKIVATGDLILATTRTPSSAGDTGITGTVVWDSSFVYVATGTNTWKRAALSTW